MFSRLSVVLCLSLMTVAGKSVAAGLPAPSVEYSADRFVETEAGTFTGKVYSAQGKERSETDMGGMQSVMILRRDKQLGWMLMPSHKMYQQMEFAQAQQQSGAAPDDQVEISEVGSESIEGFGSTKYKVLMKDGTAGGFIWITKDGIPVKMDLLSKDKGRKSRITVTLKNLSIGAQDPQLFELPSGYSAMPDMGGLAPGAKKGGGIGGALKGALSGFGTR
jgi:hypothetical protein